MTRSGTVFACLLAGTLAFVAVLSVVGGSVPFVTVQVAGSASPGSGTAGAVTAPAARAPLPSQIAPATSTTGLGCVPEVMSALAIDTINNNGIEGKRLFQQYGRNSVQNRTYSDVHQEFWHIGRGAGLEAARSAVISDVTMGCASDAAYLIREFRSEIGPRFPELDTWTDDEVAAFMSWACTSLATYGQDEAANRAEPAYGIGYTVAWSMITYSHCPGS
jgi:hypothetical protein